MASGIRIHHPTEANCTYVLVDPTRRYGEPLLCLRCSGSAQGLVASPVIHLYKTYHIILDDMGHSIVSTEIWAHLQRMQQQGVNHGFALANEVKRPPAQTVVPGAITDLRQIVTHEQ